jgi:hypothetical protein
VPEKDVSVRTIEYVPNPVVPLRVSGGEIGNGEQRAVSKKRRIWRQLKMRKNNEVVTMHFSMSI